MSAFNPIRTIEEKLSTIPISDGNLIFCIDTKHIYIDVIYQGTNLLRVQICQDHFKDPVDLLLSSGSTIGLDDVGANSTLLDKSIIFVKEVMSLYAFDITSTEPHNGTSIIKPKHLSTGRWKQVTSTASFNISIGTNGNWFIGEEDTGVEARGPIGLPGVNGVSPHIGINNNWFIGPLDTNIRAIGLPGNDGITPHIGNNNHWFIGSLDTSIKALGEDGITPHIDPTTGNWFIGDYNTGVSAGGGGGGGTIYTPGTGINISGNTISLNTSGASTGQVLRKTAGGVAWESVSFASGLPAVSSEDDGKILSVVSGSWDKSVAPISATTPNVQSALSINPSAGSTTKYLNQQGAFTEMTSPITNKTLMLTRPEIDAFIHLVIEAGPGYDFSNPITLIDTANNPADRAKINIWVGNEFINYPANGLDIVSNRLPVLINLEELTETTILRYKWTTTEGDGDWIITAFPSSGETVIPGVEGPEGPPGASIYEQQLEPLVGTNVTIHAGEACEWTVSGACTLTKGIWKGVGYLEYAFIVVTVNSGGSVSGSGITIVDPLVVGVNICTIRSIHGNVKLYVVPE